MQPAFESEYSVEVAASVRTAWEVWKKIENRGGDTSAGWVDLDEALPPGAGGVAGQLGLPPMRLRAETREGECAAVEVELPGATVRFELNFDPVSENRTRLRQRVTLEGAQAEMMGPLLGPLFEQSARAGLQTLIDAIEKSAEPKSRKPRRREP